MPRIKCHYVDCVFLDEGLCGAAAEDEWEDEEELDEWEDEEGDGEEDDEWLEEEDEF